ncbi:MAG: type IX secretion system sortase PorU, partial [Bacteroidales bacterium]|nr:type IX secretion system sortase PorU [Bacteroidales bacterium]
EVSVKRSAATPRQNSVLSNGTWYRLGVTGSGIYRIAYEDLVSYGMDPSAIDPSNIRIYGNGPGMLPEPNSIPRADDLLENAIWVSGAEDGSFNPGDDILFFGESQVTWKYNPFRLTFEHITNLYSDTTYYFLTPDLGPGKRISQVISTDSIPTDTVTTFDNYVVFEEDLSNLTKSGKEWYGKKFDMQDSTQAIAFTFPDLNIKMPVSIKMLVAAKSTVNSDFTLYKGNELVGQATVTGIPASSPSVYARKSMDIGSFYTSNGLMDLRLSYKAPTTTSFGWLNFIEINFNQKLNFRGKQLLFRNATAVGRDRIAEFVLNNITPDTRIWEITDPRNVGQVQTSSVENELRFRLPVDSLMQFLAFDASDFLNPSSVKKIENQNLHGSSNADIVMICPPIFLDHAHQLASIHQSRDQFTSLIVTPGQIYNEFSSGAKDIAALRDFVRMLYLNAPENSRPRYLLLFGDGSFDPKERVVKGSDLIPAFQSAESLIMTSSFVSDDFYGLFDEEEGSDAHGMPDIGIGRFPISTKEEADHILHKIEFYLNHKGQVLGDWRNFICFLADDEDNNLHFKQAEELASFVDSAYNQYNIDKIYFDAFPQITSPSGPRYPDATDALNSRIAEGALIINYTGHGGETGWAHERVLEASDIYSWSNIDRLPLFVTATCEFSRFDDFERTAAGELVFLNDNGGAIALITTTRVAFAESNFVLNTRFYQYAFEKIDGEYPRIGDLIRLAKSFPENDNVRNIVLLGDPALQLAYPSYSIKTTAIHSSPVSAPVIADTIRGLSTVTVSGEVRDETGSVVSGFDGILYPVVYDKPSTIHTLVNDPRSRPGEFTIQLDELFRGNVTVNKGLFTFTFRVPRDITLNYGPGRISYYAMDSIVDATGFYDEFVIGGTDNDSSTDDQGPGITLYLNDPVFKPGDYVNSQPILFVYLSDPGGINALGTGIGHDIIATLDNESEKIIVMNDYFHFDMDSYQAGSIQYIMPVLETGYHTLSLKAWDLKNNSSTVSIDFNVSDTIDLQVRQVVNYPNPFRDITYFTFLHNQFNEILSAEVWIYNIGGSLIRRIGPTEITTSGYEATSLFWDGKTETGGDVKPGVYIYHLILDNHKNSLNQLSGKLIVLD